MSFLGRCAVLPLLCVATLAATSKAGAQTAAQVAQAQADCNVDINTTGAVTEAGLAIIDAQNASGVDAVQHELKFGVKKVTEPTNSTQNYVGRAWMMGQLMVLWLSQDNQPVVTSRGHLGYFNGDTAAKIDLSIEIDSTFSIVEKQLPKCIPAVKLWRHQTGYINLMNTVFAMIQAGQTATDSNVRKLKYDSAFVGATEGQRIDPTDAYPHLAFANLAEAKGMAKEAIAQYQKMIELTKGDTLLDPTRRDARTRLIQDAINQAATSKDTAEVNADLAIATATLSDLSKDPGTQYGDFVKNALQAIALQKGDTAAISASYKSVGSDSSANYQQLISAGYAAVRANKADAIPLFRRAATVNPNFRDALYNLSILLAKHDSAAVAIPYVDKLLVVDPNNVNDLTIAKQVYSLLQYRANEAQNKYANLANALTKRADSAQRKVYGDSSKIFEDSSAKLAGKVVEYALRGDSLPVHVEFTQWEPTDSKVTIDGTITNRTLATKTVTITMEFLDKSGNVVATGKADLGPINGKPNPTTAGGQKDFEITAAGSGIVAFRYAPIK